MQLVPEQETNNVNTLVYVENSEKHEKNWIKKSWILQSQEGFKAVW